MYLVLTRKDFMGWFELAFYGWKAGAAHRFFGPASGGRAVGVVDGVAAAPRSARGHGKAGGPAV
jgi:hypothetical protein